MEFFVWKHIIMSSKTCCFNNVLINELNTWTEYDHVCIFNFNVISPFILVFFSWLLSKIFHLFCIAIGWGERMDDSLTFWISPSNVDWTLIWFFSLIKMYVCIYIISIWVLTFFANLFFRIWKMIFIHRSPLDSVKHFSLCFVRLQHYISFEFSVGHCEDASVILYLLLMVNLKHLESRM